MEDTSGSIIPGVEITATHVATGQVRKMTTGDSGAFVFPLTAPGLYTIRAQKEGFRSNCAPGSSCSSIRRPGVNFMLQIGMLSESVEVTASGMILNTDDATIGNVVEQKRVVDLPLNGRNFVNLAGLTPGVVKGIVEHESVWPKRYGDRH